MNILSILNNSKKQHLEKDSFGVTVRVYRYIPALLLLSFNVEFQEEAPAPLQLEQYLQLARLGHPLVGWEVTKTKPRLLLTARLRSIQYLRHLAAGRTPKPLEVQR